jgi:hypothetical protein
MILPCTGRSYIKAKYVPVKKMKSFGGLSGKESNPGLPMPSANGNRQLQTPGNDPYKMGTRSFGRGASLKS